MTLNLSDYIQRNISWGQYEALETKIISGNLHPGGIFVDVGANIGYYTALAASLVGATGRVLAFEPDPECFQALVSTFSTEPNIRCMQMAVSDSVGTLKLSLLSGYKVNRFN